MRRPTPWATAYNALNYPNPNLPYYPPELYDVTNQLTFPTPLASPSPGINYRQGALNLSKTDPTGLYPVWRLAITKPGAGTGVNNASNVQAHFQQHPDSAILQPQVVGSGFTANPMALDSNIWNNYEQAAIGATSQRDPHQAMRRGSIPTSTGLLTSRTRMPNSRSPMATSG